MKRYGVENGRGAHITTVYAEDEDAARERVKEVLQRPGRYMLWKEWDFDGQVLRNLDTDEVSTL